MFPWDQGTAKDELWIFNKISTLPIKAQTVGMWVAASASALLCGGCKPVALCPTRDPIIMKEKDSGSISSLRWITIWSCQASFPQEIKVLFGAY